MEAIGVLCDSVQQEGLSELIGASGELAADISCAQTLAHLNELSGRICAGNATDHLTDDVAQQLLELIQTRRIALTREPVRHLPCPTPLLSSAHTGAKTAAPAPVLAQSWKKGKEGCYWRQIDEDEAMMIMQAARRLESTRQQGQRSGPLGPVGLEILQLFINMAKACNGRLEPGLNWIAGKLKRSKDAVVNALAAICQHGLLDKRRRYEPTGHEGRGPQVKQATNAYRLIPEMAAAILKRFEAIATPPLPEDIQESQEEPATQACSTSKERESAQQSETYSIFSFINKLKNGQPSHYPKTGPSDGLQPFARRKPAFG